MKKTDKETICSDNGITYWPSYKYGKAFIGCVLILAMMYAAIVLCIVFGEITFDSTLFTVIFLVSVPLFLLILYKLALKSIYVKINVNHSEIISENHYTKENKTIKWENVISVYFNEELWYGRKSCVITYKNSEEQNCEFILPVSMVGEDKLLKFIPNNLRKNRPWL